MQEFKGTKGKWYVYDNTDYLEIKVKENFVGNVCNAIYTEVESSIPKSELENKANAQLIASAPELLKALQQLTRLHQCEQEGLSSGQPTPQQWFEAVNKAESVINKALNLENHE